MMDTRFLSPPDTPRTKLIAHFGVFGVLDAHGLQQKIARLDAQISLVTNSLGGSERNLETGGKAHGLADGESGKEKFLLRLVLMTI